MAEVHDAVSRYIARGWRPVIVAMHDKKAISKAWQNAEPRAEDFGATNNVGIKLGKSSGHLVDVDLDIPEARRLAREIPFFARLPAFGRESEVPGHLLVICRDAPATDTKFELPKSHGLELPKDVVLELRANGQTVFPPSVLKRKADDALQRVVWASGIEPSDIPNVDWAELHRMAGLLAFLAVVLAAYPDEGSRDDVCMALGGTLVRAGVDPAEAEDLIVAVARLAGDDEADTRHGKAQAAAAKIQEDGEVTGLPRLIELLGLEKSAPKLRKWLGLAKEAEGRRTAPAGAIVVQDGDINRIIDEAEVALMAHHEPIYQRGGELVRAARLEIAQSDEGIQRLAGSTMLLPVRAPWLIQAMARSVSWVKIGANGPVPVDPAEKYAHGLLGRAGEWRFRMLAGLAAAPTMDRDGRLIQTPGFDAASGFLLDFEEDAFPPIPEEPTKADAEAALHILRRPLRGFPFADEASEAVAVAAILTGLVRSTMQTAPLHAFDAPTPGTGKSLLTSIIGIIATGREPAAMSQGKDPEEDEKRLSAALRSGDPVLLIDNCEKEVTGDFLCSMLTQLVVSPRILGQTELLRLPCRVLLMATGNNLKIAADMTRRALKCRLDARVEQPEKRAFDFDCVQEVRETRGALVAAALTILRAYVIAGRPGDFAPLGGFKDYDLVRGALLWLGMADPDTTREEIVANDPGKALLAEILTAWRAVYGDRAVKVAEIMVFAASKDDARQRLHELLVQVSGGRWDAPKIGRYLSNNRDRPVDGLAFRAVKSGKLNTWSVATNQTSRLSDDSHKPRPEADVADRVQEEIPF